MDRSGTFLFGREGTVIILDDGTVVDNASTLNFTGTGVTLTSTSDQVVEVEVSGGGGGGSGDVSKVGTPVDNQVGVWTGDGTIEGTAGLTYTGTDFGVTGDITVSGTVDGRDVAADGTKLDGIESGATADQTGAEIKAAYEGEANTNAFTDAEQTKLAGIATGANDYSHPNHTGDVTSVGDGATTIANDAVTYAKMQNVVGNNVILGNNAGANSVVDELSASEVRTILNVEDGATADQTGAEIKAAYEGEANTNAFTDAEQTKLAGIATGAEVNVVDSVNTQTGAVVLDADDISDAATTNKFTTASDISKLAGIESNATADQTDVEIETAYNNQVAVVSQVDAEAGTSTTAFRWTPQRVAQAIAALETGGGGGTWGSITGTLSDQTDLQGELDAKVDIAGDTMTGDLVMEKVDPAIFLYDTDGTADDRKTRISQTGDTLRFSRMSDNNASSETIALMSPSTLTLRNPSGTWPSLNSSGTIKGSSAILDNGLFTKDDATAGIYFQNASEVQQWTFVYDAAADELTVNEIGVGRAALFETQGTTITDDQAVVTKEKGDARYIQTGDGGTVIKSFMVAGDGGVTSQTTTGTLTDLTGIWASPTITNASFSWNGATGTLTVLEAGPVEFDISVMGHQASGGNRSTMQIALEKNGSTVLASTYNYASRNTTDDKGGCHINGFFDEASVNDIYRVQIANSSGVAMNVNDSSVPRGTWLTAKLYV